MKLSIELILAIWGAVLATVLAVINIIKEYRQRPKLSVDAKLISRPCGEDEDTHGVKIKVERGLHIISEEVLVEFTVRNSGLQSIQVNAVYVETETNIAQIIPSSFPVVLQPNTSVTASVQPELFVPLNIDPEALETDVMQLDVVLSIGIFDALSNKHSVDKEKLDKVVKSCRALPLRVGVFKHTDTGKLVTAFEMKDKGILIYKKGQA
jgi:hypothetical protein